MYSTPGTADTLLSGIQNQTTSTDKFTQEFRLVSPESDTFEWLLGAYYTDEDSAIIQQIHRRSRRAPNIPARAFRLLADLSIDSTYEELALFANATWHVTDRFDLSFGGRWSENDQDAAQTCLIVLPILPGGRIGDFDDLKSSESPFTWSVSPRYEFTDTTSVYLRVATGFRPGGPNVLPPGHPREPASYDSDELTSYELGLRTGTDTAASRSTSPRIFLDWEDIQLFAVVNGVGINANGGTAESKGVEFTATARATDGLSLTLTGAYTDAELTEDTDPGSSAASTATALPYVPEWTLGARRRLRVERFRRCDGLCRRPGRLHQRPPGGLRQSRRSAGPDVGTARGRRLYDRSTCGPASCWTIGRSSSTART